MNEVSKTVVTLLHLIFCHVRVHCSNLSDVANLKRDWDSVYVRFVVVHCKEIEIIHRLILGLYTISALMCHHGNILAHAPFGAANVPADGRFNRGTFQHGEILAR